MSQAGAFDPNMKEVFGSESKTRYDDYTDEELGSDEFFWNQLRVIVEMKNTEYLSYFLRTRSDYLDRMCGM